MAKKALKVVDHAARAHAPLPPSSAYIWTACPGAPSLWDKMPVRPAGKEAAEGTLAHEYCEKAAKIACGNLGVKAGARLSALLLTIEDEEMRHHVLGYYDFIWKINQKFMGDAPGVRGIEAKVELNDTIYGTADFVVAKQMKSGKWHAVIVDFKYGKGVNVSPDMNPQLMTYAVALEASMNKPLEKVYLYIYQPRTPGREYPPPFVMVKDDLQKWKDAILEVGWEATQMREGKQKPIFNAGEHCTFCPAQAVCPALKKQALDLIEPYHLTEDQVVDVQTVPLEEVVRIFKKKDQIKKLLNEMEKYLTHLLTTGKAVPEFKLVEGRRSRKWIEDIDTAEKELIKLGVNFPHKISLIGIGEAERIIGKGAKEKIAHITELSTPKVSLAHESDKREAIDDVSSLDLLDSLEIDD